MISATVVQDSISPSNKRITTLELSYPRCIHGELMTHRVFSRNAMSSRAVPVAKMIEQVRKNPFVPLEWGMNQPGMQAKVLATPDEQWKASGLWLAAAENAARAAEALSKIGLHKQIVNRVLEPFQWMKTIVTATEWDNFFELRDHPDAEPHFQRLAKVMRVAMYESVPTFRGCDPDLLSSWHLPYITGEERSYAGQDAFEALRLVQSSAARCARVSYLTHDNERPSVAADTALFHKLVGSRPAHASPVEHQAFPLPVPTDTSGNLVGWSQFRKLLGL